MTIDREPLYDLDGVLLGHSCRALIPESYFMKEVTVERKRRLQEEIGLDKKSRGTTSIYKKWEHTCVIEWFQPL